MSPNPVDKESEPDKEEKKPAFLSKGKKQKSIFNVFSRDKEERKEAASSFFSSISAKVSSTVNSISNTVNNKINNTPEEDPAEKAAREEEERIKREAAERARREEEERIRKQREEEERKRREEEERLRKKNMIKDKLMTGIACKKHCSRGKPHDTTVTLIEHTSKGLTVTARESIKSRSNGCVRNLFSTEEWHCCRWAKSPRLSMVNRP